MVGFTISLKKNEKTPEFFSGWWARATPLKNMSSSQLGWWLFPIFLGKCQIDGNQSPPTRLEFVDLWFPKISGQKSPVTTHQEFFLDSDWKIPTVSLPPEKSPRLKLGIRAAELHRRLRGVGLLRDQGWEISHGWISHEIHQLIYLLKIPWDISVKKKKNRVYLIHRNWINP